MNIGILGTGMVEQTLAASPAGLGNDVVVGTRDIDALMARRVPGAFGNVSYAVWGCTSHNAGHSSL